jgi:hypothetical protein
MSNKKIKKVLKLNEKYKYINNLNISSIFILRIIQIIKNKIKKLNKLIKYEIKYEFIINSNKNRNINR